MIFVSVHYFKLRVESSLHFSLACTFVFVHLYTVSWDPWAHGTHGRHGVHVDSRMHACVHACMPHPNC